ncbi:hypothetical protein EJB05_41952, partial [Eragrostis curvula]
MDRPRATWDHDATKKLLDLCMVEKRDHNFNSVGPTKQGWSRIHKGLQEAFQGKYDHRQASNKLGALKRAYHEWLDLKHHTGLGRDPETGGVAADASFWEAHQQNKKADGEESSSVKTNGKPPPFLEELEYLYGKTPKERGKLLCAGGINVGSPSAPLPGTQFTGVPGATPSTPIPPSPALGASPSTPVAANQFPGGGPFFAVPGASPSTPVHAGSPCAVEQEIGRWSEDRPPSKRTSGAHSVNSPSKKSRRSSMEDAVMVIAQTFAKDNIMQSKKSDEAQLDQVHQILEADGIMEGTEPHLKAITLCKDHLNRANFLRLKTLEARLAWIDFSWKITHGGI